MYLIENPQKTTLETNWRQQKYPFQQMDIGEYFLVPKTEVKQSSLAASASWASKKFGKKFITESFGEFTKVTRVKNQRLYDYFAARLDGHLVTTAIRYRLPPPSNA